MPSMFRSWEWVKLPPSQRTGIPEKKNIGTSRENIDTFPGSVCYFHNFSLVTSFVSAPCYLLLLFSPLPQNVFMAPENSNVSCFVWEKNLCSTHVPWSHVQVMGIVGITEKFYAMQISAFYSRDFLCVWAKVVNECWSIYLSQLI